MREGWYEDPAAEHTLRWWDGNAWTAHTRPHPRRRTGSAAVEDDRATPPESAPQPLAAESAPAELDIDPAAPAAWVPPDIGDDLPETVGHRTDAQQVADNAVGGDAPGPSWANEHGSLKHGTPAGSGVRGAAPTRTSPTPTWATKPGAPAEADEPAATGTGRPDDAEHGTHHGKSEAGKGEAGKSEAGDGRGGDVEVGDGAHEHTTAAPGRWSRYGAWPAHQYTPERSPRRPSRRTAMIAGAALLLAAVGGTVAASLAGWVP